MQYLALTTRDILSYRFDNVFLIIYASSPGISMVVNCYVIHPEVACANPNRAILDNNITIL